jgi:hypothetical protein
MRLTPSNLLSHITITTSITKAKANSRRVDTRSPDKTSKKKVKERDSDSSETRKVREDKKKAKNHQLAARMKMSSKL